MQGITFWIVVALIAVAIGVIAFVALRRKPNPHSLESLGIIPRSMKDDAAELAGLRQSLRLKTMHNDAMMERLVAAERERMPTASELEWYRAAVERWERDNR